MKTESLNLFQPDEGIKEEKWVSGLETGAPEAESAESAANAGKASEETKAGLWNSGLEEGQGQTDAPLAVAGAEELEKEYWRSGLEKEPEKKKNSVGREILSWILHIGVTVLVALFINAFLFQFVRVDGSSMLDSLTDKDIMFVTKYDYILGQPENGDVIICRFPGERNEGKTFVKRIVGCPGDVIEFREGKLFRNGEEVRETYLTEYRNRDGYTMPAMTLGEDEYFVCGDNRDNSHDSRTLITWNPEPILREHILGHARFVFYHPIP